MDGRLTQAAIIFIRGLVGGIVNGILNAGSVKNENNRVLAFAVGFVSGFVSGIAKDPLISIIGAIGATFLNGAAMSWMESDTQNAMLARGAGTAACTLAPVGGNYLGGALGDLFGYIFPGFEEDKKEKNRQINKPWWY